MPLKTRSFPPRRSSGAVASRGTFKVPWSKNTNPRVASRGFYFLKSIQVRSKCEQIQEALRLLLVVDVVFLCLQSVLEVLNTFAQTFCHLRNLLSAKQQNGDYQNDHQLREAY